MSRPKLALYWAASCGGCEIAVLDLGEKLLQVAEHFELVFWPCTLDFKYEDVRRWEDRSIDLCLFNGGIRTEENEEMAKLLRRKSEVMVAFGTCAREGGIPGLANLSERQAIMERCFLDSPTLDNPQETVPTPAPTVPEGELRIPSFRPHLLPLDAVVAVDYYIPGCPPQPHQVELVLDTIMAGGPLPEKGAVLGAGEKTCCEECPRSREEKRIREFKRFHQVTLDGGSCLLDQGLLCMGPATRSGCGALCVSAGMPCRGCYGPPPACTDQGAKMISAISSIIDSQDPREVERIVDSIPDLMGIFYRFGMAASILAKGRK